VVSTGKQSRGRGLATPRRAVTLIALIASLVLALTSESGPDYLQRRLEQLAAGSSWSAVDWEARHLPRGLELVAGQAFSPPAEETLRDQIVLLLSGQSPLDSQAAQVVAAAVTQQLRAAGVRSVGGAVGPPVAFTVSEPPTVLIVSPRSEIRLAESVLLRDDVDLAAAEGIEAAAERLNVSALVERTGGIATYPTLIAPGTTPFAALQTVAHEWTHTALFLMPLGRAYGSSPETQAINETVADLVGQEVAQRAATSVGQQPEGRGAADRTLVDSLRRIRVNVDQLLASGEVDNAEVYMEAERKALVGQGYAIRRLNQAYFAFHGNYAEGPAASTEIPDTLRQLRAESASLSDFIGRAGGITRLSDLKQLVGHGGDPDRTN